MSINKTKEIIELLNAQQETLTGVLVVMKEFEDSAETTNLFSSIISQKHELGMAGTHTVLAEAAKNLQSGNMPMMASPGTHVYSFDPDDLDGFAEEDGLDDEDITDEDDSPESNG